MTGIGGIFFYSDNPDRINSLQWKPFKYGVTILDGITAYNGIGKFVHIMDAENNKIELWEPED